MKAKFFRPLVSSLSITLTSAALLSGQSSATDIVWGTNLGAGPWVWNTGANWTGGTAPVVNTDRGDLRTNWTAAATINLNAATITNGILFDDTGASGDVGVTIGNGGTAGNTLTLAGTAPSISVIGSLNISAVLAGNTAWSKSGAGTLNLSNIANTGTGAVSVTAGTLQFGTLANTQNYAFTGTALTLNGATLQLSGSSGGTVTQNYNFANLASAISVTGSSISFAQTNNTTQNFVAALSFSGSNILNMSASAFSGHTVGLSRTITGSGTLTFNTSGAATARNFTISGTSNNYTGTVVLNTAAAASTFNLNSSLGAAAYEIRNSWTMVNGAAGALNAATGISIFNTGTLTLTNPWVNSSASLTLNAGTVNLGASNSTIGSLNVAGSSAINSGGGTLATGPITLSAGTLSGTGVLVPAASGSIVNTGATAGVTISSGLNFSNSGVNVNIADLNPSGSDLFLAGTVTGSAGFTKSGTGALAFNGNATISGQINVSAGIIQINSTPTKSFTGGLSGSGTINVGGTGLVTLSGASSGYTGTVNVADGASFAGEADTAGPLIIGSSTGAKLYPDTSTPTAAYTASNITLNAVTPILFATQPPAGTYSILKYTGTLTGSAANLSANYRGAVLDMGTGSNSEITLTLGSAVSLIWNNAATTSIWATGSEANWLNGAGNDVFYTADGVTFDDTPASNQDITITDAVVPGGVTFNNSARDYSISGGAITGLTSVVKGGSAIATLAAANSYSGGTTLNNGTLRIGDSAALGTAALAINGGTLSSKDNSPISISNAITFNNNATLGNATDNGAVTLSGPISLTAGLDVTTNSDVLLSGVVSGTGNSLGKSGTGTLTVTGTNTYGSTNVDAGTLQVGTGGAAGTIPGPATITSPGTLRYFRNDAALTLANDFSGNGTLAFKGTGTSNQSSYTLTGSNSSLTGTLAIESGARVFATTATQLGSAANVNISSGGETFLNAGTYANAFNIAGNGWTETAGQLGAIRLGLGANITGPVTLTADARITPFNSTGTLSGTLTGTSSLEINATTSASFTGTLTYSGNGSAFTGATTVSQGTLNLTGSLGGAVNVSSTSYAATLSGEGTIAGNLTLGAVGFGATLTIDPTTSGALATNGTLNVAEAGTVVAVSFSPSLTSAGTYTVVTHGGTTATPANFALVGTYRTPTFDTTTDPNAVTVSLTSANLTWEGNASTAWDINTTSNWETPGPVSEKYFEVDAVTFDDTAILFAPTLAATVNPASVTFNNSVSDYTLSGAGVIAGSGTLTKSGTANVNLSTPNTYTGNVTVNGGKLILGNAAALGNSTAGAKAVTVNSGGQIDFSGQSPTARTYSFKISGTGDGTGALVNTSATSIASNAGILNLELLDDATIGGTGRFDIGLANAVGGLITGNGKTLTKTGTSQIQLRGDASATAINILVNQGTLGAETNDNALGGATGSVTVASGATLGSFGVRSIATPVTLNTGATLSNLGGGAGTWTGTVATSGSVTVNPAGQTINLNGTVSGTGTITVPAAGGILNLSGTNTFNGGLIITDLTNNTATTVNLPSTYSLSVASGKPIRVGNTTGTGAFSAQTFNVGGAVSNDGTLFVGRSGNLNVNSGATWTQNGDMTVGGQGGYSAVMSVNSGTTFTYAGTSTIKINPGSSGFGNLFIDGLFTTSRGFETTVVGGTTYQVTLRNGGTLKLSANVADLTTGATNKTQFALGTGGGIIDTNGFDAGLSRAITGTGNSLTKIGAGTLTLTGANTYTGDTLLNVGTLAGNGTSTSKATAASGTTIAPGVAIGTFTAAGADLSAGATLAIQIDSSTDTADKLVATAAVNITSASVSFAEIGSGIITAGTKLTILDYTGTTLTGTFTGYAEGASISVGSNTFTLSYVDSSKVTLTSTTVGSPYDTWASTSGLDGTPGKDPAFDADPEGDGIANGLEWILGGNPLAQDAASLVTATASAAGGLTLTFNREEDSIGQATLTVEYDSDLVGPWTSYATVGATSSGPVTINTVPDPDAVSVNIPASNAAGGKLFGRLKATQP